MKKDHMLGCGSEDSSHFGTKTFISPSRYNCWQQTHKDRKKNLKFHNRLQSPVVFLLTAKTDSQFAMLV